MDFQNIVLVGAGNVATHLGKALRAAGYCIRQVYSRTEESARQLAACLDCAYTVCPEQIVTDAGLYIVSVKDAVLEDLIPRVAARSAEALFVHTAGSVPMEIWKGWASRYGVLYPMQTFSKQREVDFSEVSFFVEAVCHEDGEALKHLAAALGSKVYEATSEQRRFLHIAAVFACNFSNHMYAVAQHLLEKNGMPFEVMYPLMEETVRKIRELPPVEAQTGPARRDDRNVMNSHLEMLAAEPRLAEIYEAVSRNIYEYASCKENKDKQ